MRPSTNAAACLLALLSASPAQSQQVYVTLCRTHFVVTDRTGHAATKALMPDDVTVFDNDVPQPLSELRRIAQAPVSVALIIDRSQSVSDRFGFLSRAAAAFVASVVRERDDRGLVVAFDSKVYLLQDWTADAGRLVHAIQQLTAAGGTSLFDALLKTCRDKFDVTDGRRKVAILMTDGEDTTSLATFEEALQMATRSSVTVYVIGVRAEGSLNTREQQGRRVLSTLADLTGGRVFYPEPRQEDQLLPLFTRLQEELRNEYDATYYLQSPPDDAFHRVRIEPKDNALVVHAPTGYYLRKPPSPR
jgi:Ca-activated chloride channel family protein